MRYVLTMLVRSYQWFVSPALHTLVPVRSGCRFAQTCSDYFVERVQHYGVFQGVADGIARLLRCHPFSVSYTSDRETRTSNPLL